MLVAKDYLDVFQGEGIITITTTKEWELSINLLPRTVPISKASYRRAPAQLQELKLQLKEMFDKGFIRPSFTMGCTSVVC